MAQKMLRIKQFFSINQKLSIYKGRKIPSFSLARQFRRANKQTKQKK